MRTSRCSSGMPTRARIVGVAMRRVFDRLGSSPSPGWLLPLLAACVPGVSPDQAEPHSAAHDDAHEPERRGTEVKVDDGAGPLELEVDGAEPRAPVQALPDAPGRELAPSHVERAAWSADGRTFVHCRRLSAIDCTECRLLHHDGTAEVLESGPGCGDQALPHATLDARLAALALVPEPSRWSAGADVVLVVETRELEQTNAGESRAMLKLGARRRAGGPPAWLVYVDPCEGCGTDQVCAAAAHFDALALSPEGDQLAVLLHQRSSQGDESTRVELLSTERVAAAARSPASQALP